MKHNIFRYIAIAATLLATVVNAGAQYNYKNGVATSKTVDQIDAESYKIRLETFATGSTTVTESDKPLDVVLVLDVSGSMDFPKGPVTAETKAFTYNDIANSDYTYFYEDSDGDLWKVYARQNGNNYDLYYYPGNPHRIGSQRDDPDTPITQYHSAGWSWGSWHEAYYDEITLYRGTETRMEALKEAVNMFISDIDTKDQKKDDDGQVTGRVGHRISIIKFAGNTTNTVGNTTYDGTGGTTNYSQIVMNLTAVEGNVATMQAAVNGFKSMGGTQAGYGMAHANTVLATADPDHEKVVVFFTDGNPDDNRAAIGSANGNQGAGTNAYRAKNAQGAVVYTIGMFTESPDPNGNTYKYLNYVSSNYPKATVTSSGSMTAGDGSDQGYYQDASGNIDLTKIFKKISEGIGGATKEIGTSTQVRDIVTNSFVLPDNVSTADVKVYTSAATGSGTGSDDETPTWGTDQSITLPNGSINIVDVDAEGNPTTDATKVKNKALFVTNFDYSADDTSEGAGDGNWVGQRYKDGKWTWAGKKLIIEFKVKANSEATGGETQTNTGNSGVYLLNDDGKTYTCINNYEQPHTTLTVNIKIRKTGLRHGESATFELMRIRPKGWDETKTVEENKENIEYNIIGKPIPGTIPYNGSADQPDQSDYYEKMGWVGFKKIILTNKGKDGAEVVKEVLVLDPYWVYMVLEDDWGWAYTMTGDAQQVGEDGTYTTSSVEVNPFKFHNTENADAVKHAEAIMINHFKSSLSGAKVEHTKSSKVESFTTPTN